MLVTPVLRPESSVTHRWFGELLLAHDNPSLNTAICHAQERDDRRVIAHVQERDVFLGTYLSVIEHAEERDVFCHSSKQVTCRAATAVIIKIGGRGETVLQVRK